MDDPCCAICLAPIAACDYSLVEHCFHSYHHACIVRWIATLRSSDDNDNDDSFRPICPYCKRPFCYLYHDIREGGSYTRVLVAGR